MAKEYQRDVRMAGTQSCCSSMEIGNQILPTIPSASGSKMAKLIGSRGRPAMAAMIDGIDSEAAGIEKLGQWRITLAVFSHAMRNQEHRTRLGHFVPAMQVDLVISGCIKRKSAAYHTH